MFTQEHIFKILFNTKTHIFLIALCEYIFSDIHFFMNIINHSGWAIWGGMLYSVSLQYLVTHSQVTSLSTKYIYIILVINMLPNNLIQKINISQVLESKIRSAGDNYWILLIT